MQLTKQEAAPGRNTCYGRVFVSTNLDVFDHMLEYLGHPFWPKTCVFVHVFRGQERDEILCIYIHILYASICIISIVIFWGV